MWSVPPKELCNRHLLGEHVEMHMFKGTIEKGISIKGYIDKKLVNPRAIKTRHDAVAEEMVKRGMNHRTPLEMNCKDLPEHPLSIKRSREELMKRCPDCIIRIKILT